MIVIIMFARSIIVHLNFSNLETQKCDNSLFFAKKKK
jgi:hypothetical protein